MGYSRQHGREQVELRNDHGLTHAIIASTNAIRIFDLLILAGLTPDVVSSGAGDADDACLTVAIATLLHAILAHDFDPPPLTFEAGVVSVADGTDVTQGRGRKTFDLGADY